VRGQISMHTSKSDQRRIDIALPVLWAAFLTLLVAGPWLRGGYIFGTDWPGPRRFDFPVDRSNSAPLQVALAEVSRIASGEWTGKLFVLGLLFVGALMAYRAVPAGGFVPRAVASTVFLANPFVFGRLHYGQLYLLAGYALLPWVAIRLRRLLEDPGAIAALVLAAGVALIGVATAHLVLAATVLAGAQLLTQVLAERRRLQYLLRVGPSLLLAAVAALLASSYWVVPTVLGRGQIASAVAGFTTGDVGAFAAVPDPHLGLLPNLLGLYGFWAENTGRFTSMKSFVPIWPVIVAGLLAVAAIGVAWALKQRRDHLGAWVTGLLIAALIALVLEVGVSSAVTRGLVAWLDASIPVYRGMRDAGKWAALLALVYSQLIGLGTTAILEWLRALPRPGIGKEWIGAIAVGLLLGLPLYYGNGLLYGMHGEIKPSQYPPGWYAADRVLAADNHPGRALFLPWHEYMAYTFIENQNKVVVSPAPTFFSVPVLISSDPEVPGISPPADPDQVAISNLVHTGPQAPWARVLTTLGVKYVLVAHEVDWLAYEYLVNEQNMVKVADYGSIVLYRNNLAT
jgi:hypothetical protein